MILLADLPTAKELRLNWGYDSKSVPNASEELSLLNLARWDWRIMF